MSKLLYLYNSLTKQKELFTPINPKQVTVYTCGPTVYSYAHIGNMSAYLMADILIRVLKYICGYEVKHVKNITDVGHLTSDADEGEDKMQKAAQKEGKTVEDIANHYTSQYISDEEKLNMIPPFARPKATDYIEYMMNMVKDLVDKGYGYETSDGVYMDISKIKNYGMLSGNVLEELDVGSRVQINNKKKHPADFALWKKADKNHLQQWDSPWGKSFPGWHLECSAMAWSVFGDTYDIKTGGEDNIFPHHECEVAQTQACYGKKLSNYFVHKRHINLDGQKMSKSLGRVVTLSDLEAKGFSAKSVRLALISSHYRNRLNFQDKLIEDFQKTIDKVERLRIGDKRALKVKIEELKNKELLAIKQAFDDALLDDLNMPKALVALYDLIAYSSHVLDGEVRAVFEHMNLILAVFDFDIQADTSAHTSKNIPEEIINLAEERKVAKAKKDFQKSDQLRDQIQDKGYVIVDTAEGYDIQII